MLMTFVSLDVQRQNAWKKSNNPCPLVAGSAKHANLKISANKSLATMRARTHFVSQK
jgi:hypothetical protein